MRVAIVAESFAPRVDGVAGSVARVLEHLDASGHDAVVVAPGPGSDRHGGIPVIRTASLPVPGYRSFPVGVSRSLAGDLARFRPDVVHLAAPVALGAAGAMAARSLGVPRVAVYQTDLAGFAARYRLGAAGPAVWAWLRRVHRACDLTLAPSTHAAWMLDRHGIGPVATWGRGVDLDRFHPARRSELWRRCRGAPGRLLVGAVGRLAREKRLERLAPLSHRRDVHLIVVGDGPDRRRLGRVLAGATFTGLLGGDELATTVASLDVLVHAGTDETFCQAVQEALAAGVPVVAPAAGGPVDLVRHGVNGFLYPPDRPELIAPAVEVLRTDAARRRSMAEAARPSVRGRSWAVLGQELIAHYGAVGAGGHPAGVGGVDPGRRAA